VQVAEVFDAADFAGAVACAGSFQFVFGDTIAIIRDADQAQPTAAYLYTYFMRVRINGILH
jgi:hypothetical protein